MADKYKQTMNLPKTDFAMRAGLAKREPERLREWQDSDLYGQLLKKNEGHQTFILHDGPPYANGPIHVGHAQNKISKDIINRYKSMRGFLTPYVPGWDCHGQPIEHKVEQELGTERFNQTPVEQIRAMCREYAVKNIDVQREGFKRLGVLGQWDDPYLTFTHEYDAADIKILKKVFDRGAIYRGRKPVHWCKHDHTALAEAELEYWPETSPSIFVAFKLTSVPAGLTGFEDATHVMVWTTTPWTLPANVAVIVHPEGRYVAVVHEGQAYIMVRPRVEAVCAKAGWEPVLATNPDGTEWEVSGVDLLDVTYRHPIFDEEQGRIIYGDFVGMDEGTGCVHTAPGHGMDDYNVASRFGLPIVMPVDDNGRLYTGEGLGTGGPFGGLDTDEANPVIIDWLNKRGTLVASESIEHSYPHCWRCKNPVIFRATSQWFVSMDETGLRQEAMDAIENDVTWYPAHASRRIGSMVQQRPDWCISRQRSWGVPIPSYTCQDCNAKVLNDQTLDKVIDLFERKGSDAWYTDEPSDYLGDACVCPSCGGHNLKADRDILDVWWDSGVSHTAVLGNREGLSFPADMYLEGSDQHRGWFQSSLLTSVGAYGKPPYRSVVSQGFVLDGQGRKMSKSLGNVIDPNEVCATLGADVLRLWVASVDSSADVAIDNDILKRTSDAYRRFRNSIRFLLSELFDFDPATDAVSVDELLPVDRMALARMCEVHEQVEEAYEGYRFNAVFRTLYEYVVTELSNVYLDVVKDRTYCDRPEASTRRSAQTVLAQILSMLVHDLQPILVFTCDEALQHMPESMREGVTRAALLSWYDGPMNKETRASVLPSYTAALQVRNAVTKALEDARAVGTLSKSQQANVVAYAPEPVVTLLKDCGLDLAEFFIVASAELLVGEGDQVSATVSLAQGDRCERCWNVREIGEDGLCERCHDAVAHAHDAAAHDAAAHAAYQE